MSDNRHDHTGQSSSRSDRRKQSSLFPDREPQWASTQENESQLSEVDMGDFDPFEIDFLPEFRQGRGPEKPFVNEHGVLIGDHQYESSNSPLEQWTENTDPSVMAGDQWVHPFKDIGFQTEENREFFEQGIVPEGAAAGGRFMHPDKDVAYEANLENVDGEPDQPLGKGGTGTPE